MSTVFRTVSGPPKTQKNTNFWHSTLVFPERGAPDQKKIAKNPQFLTLDSRIPAEACFEHEKIAKNHQFLTFFGDFRSFFISRKSGRMRQNESWAQFSGQFRDPQKRKKNPIFDTRPSFSLRGVRPTKKKSQKTLSFWHSTAGFPERGAPDQKKSQKSQKTLSFWHSTRTFPERGCAGHVFRDYWVALNWKRKEKQERERGKMMMVRWWWEDDDDEMMMRWWWWWDDDDEMMMIGRRISQEIFLKEPFADALGKNIKLLGNGHSTNKTFFLRLPNGQYGPVSQLSRSEKCCTGPFNWGEAHCAGEKVKRKTGPFLRKSLWTKQEQQHDKGAQPATATRNPPARLPGARAKNSNQSTQETSQTDPGTP